MSKKIDLNGFLIKSRKVHGEKYIYSKVKFLHSATDKVNIICKFHGDFYQQANVHYGGSGCPSCAKNVKIPVIKLISEFNRIHGFKYKYPFSEYGCNKDKIKIHCPKHGLFVQAISDHKSGKGCASCAAALRGNSARLKQDEFLQRCALKHSNKYDYSLSIYEGQRKKIKIICPDHGVFEQTAHTHLVSGCLKCGKGLTGWKRSDFIKLSRNYHDGRSLLYVIKLVGNNEEFYKVGITNHDVDFRFRGKSLPYSLSVVTSLKGEAGWVWDMEKKLHKTLKSYKYKPEKHFDGHTECFLSIPKEILKSYEDVTLAQP